jgi:hypothetical protein
MVSNGAFQLIGQGVLLLTILGLVILLLLLPRLLIKLFKYLCAPSPSLIHFGTEGALLSYLRFLVNTGYFKKEMFLALG